MIINLTLALADAFQIPVLRQAFSVVRHFTRTAYTNDLVIMTRRFSLIYLILILTSTYSCGQNNNNYLLWSATRKLTTNDFAIKTKQLETIPSFAQFSLDYQVNGFDFLTKNFNKKVHNYLIATASWIDTTSNVQQSLVYQQTLFDMCETYARRFRKALKDNRKKL